MSDPHIVLCYGTTSPVTDLRKFAVLDVHDVSMVTRSMHTLKSLSDYNVPVLLICEIKSNSSGDLTYEVCNLLNI